MTFQVHDDVSRRAARKLLRQRGLPTSDVHRMSYAALAAALEAQADPSLRATFDALVASWRATPPPWKAGQPATGGPSPTPSDPVPAAREPVAAAVAAALPGGSPGTVDAAIAALVAAVAPKGPAIDMTAVAAMVESAVAKAVSDRLPQTIRIEMGGAVREVTGIRHERFPEVLKAMEASLKTGKLHVWLPGPAGSGKSTLAVQCAEALGYTMATEADPYDAPDRIYVQQAVETSFGYLGYKSPTGDVSTLMVALRRAWQYGGVIVLDDTDRSSAKALATLNMPLANAICQFPDGMVRKHPRCLIVATANTFGLGGGSDYVGAGRLDKATLDRFFPVEIGYDERAERAIAAGMGADASEWCATVQRVRAAVRRLGIKHLITPRATIKGATLLAAGVSRSLVETGCLYAGLDDETVRRVKGAL